MQINPKSSLESELKNITSNNLEDLVAATLSYLGYTVFPDLHLERAGEQICEVDVFASLQTPFHESRLVFECKGGEPDFNDIRKFASLRNLLKPPPTKTILICKQGTRESRKELAGELGIQVFERDELCNWILPLLSGMPLRPERVEEINRWLTVYQVQRYLLSQRNAPQEIKAHLRFISKNLLSDAQPIEQAKESLEAATGQHKNTTKKVADSLGLSLDKCLASAPDDRVEAAMQAELLHRMANMYAVTRCALQMQMELGRGTLLGLPHPNLRQAINIISKNPRILFGFPGFFQYWVCQWGGIVPKNDEIDLMAQQCSTTHEAVDSYLEIIKLTYTSTSELSAGMFSVRHGTEFFKFIPAAYRAIGSLHRKSLGLDQNSPWTPNEISYYLQALDRALREPGGRTSLR